MDKARLFEILEKQDLSVLIDLLDLAYDEMDINQRRSVFGEIVKKIPASVIDAKELLKEIKVFHKKSLNRKYYAPFNINSKNYMHIPEKTEEWFETLGDFLKNITRVTEQGEHLLAIKCFGLLYELIDKMEDGEEIVFADELGNWMIPGDEKKFISAYITSLAVTSTPEEFTKATLPLIHRDSCESFANKVYSSVIGAANKEQRTYLEGEIKRQNIRTKPN